MIKKTLPWIDDRIDDLLGKLETLVRENQRPASEVILDDDDALKILKICKRSLATLRSDGLLSYSKVKGKVYYRLSDILALIEFNKIPIVTSSIKIHR